MEHSAPEIKIYLTVLYNIIVAVFLPFISFLFVRFIKSTDILKENVAKLQEALHLSDQRADLNKESIEKDIARHDKDIDSMLRIITDHSKQIGILTSMSKDHIKKLESLEKELKEHSTYSH